MQETQPIASDLYTHVQAERWQSKDAWEIRTLFYSGNSLSDHYWWDCEAIHQGIVRDRLLDVQRFKIPQLIPTRREEDLYRQAGKESSEHQALKFSVAKWLIGIGAVDLRAECWPSPDMARADLYTPSFGGVVVECGNTIPERLGHLKHGVKHFLLVPFADMRDEQIDVYGFALLGNSA